ncbi:MAG TPA: DUF2848 family protein [Terriglobia bacterium]
MSTILSLQLDGASVDFPVRRALVAGYTGRDSAKVRAHIEELERQGIAAPDRVPSVYVIHPSLVTTETDVAIGVRQVSGEVEAALLFPGNRLEDALVSVIVDFTDREEERRSIQRSKELPKPLSRRVWRYKDVAGCWDAIALRSWVGAGTNCPLYQSGTLGALLAPPDLLARLRSDHAGALGESLEGTVILTGTVPLLAKEFLFTDYFACELETPDRRKLSLECTLLRTNPR